jgi:hypothetical protein
LPRAGRAGVGERSRRGQGPADPEQQSERRDRPQ